MKQDFIFPFFIELKLIILPKLRLQTFLKIRFRSGQNKNGNCGRRFYFWKVENNLIF